jgi:hypothetical protein
MSDLAAWQSAFPEAIEFRVSAGWVVIQGVGFCEMFPVETYKCAEAIAEAKARRAFMVPA